MFSFCAAEFCCNGTVVDDPELGQVSLVACLGGHVDLAPLLERHTHCLACCSALSLSVIVCASAFHCCRRCRLLVQVIQLQGDQRKNVLQFLTQEGLVKKDFIKIHGF